MKHSIQKHIILSALSVGLIAALFTSCEKKEIQFGSQFGDNSYTQVIETDTITPYLSSIYIDSFVTSNTGSGIIGYTTDPEFGTMQSSANFQLAVPTYSQTSTEYEDVTFDSLTIYAKINSGKWYGDTTKPIKLNVYRLASNIVLPDNQTAFYNTSPVNILPTPLGSYSLKLRPNALDSTNDTLSIRLSDDLGKDLLAKLKTGNDSIQSTDQFLHYFKGIKIAADQSSDLSFSISDSIQMRLYYRKPENPEAVEKYVSFPMYDAATQFNNVIISRTGDLAKQDFGKQNPAIASSQTHNTALLNPLAGSMIKMTFPSLNSVLRVGYIKITRAILQIFPAQNTYNGIFGLPQTLNLVTTDLNNGIGGALIGSDGSTAQTGSLTYNDPNITIPYYTYDLTGELAQLLSDPLTTINQKGLLLIPPSSTMYSSFNRLIIGDANNTFAGMKLIIDYISIK